MLDEDQRNWYDRALTRAVEIMFASDWDGAQVWFGTHDTNFRFVTLYRRDWGPDKGLWIMVPRGPEMKPHYPRFRAWFDSHELSWKDRTVDGRRYMAAMIWGPPYSLAQSGETDGVAAILRAVKSIAAEIFETSIIRATSDEDKMKVRLSGMKMSIFMPAALMVLGAASIFFVLQIVNIFTWGAPSLSKVSGLECGLLACLYGAVIALRLCSRQFSDPYPHKPESIWFSRAFKQGLVLGALVLLPMMSAGV